MKTLLVTYNSKEKEVVTQIQETLQRIGLYDFAIDGEFSFATENAIRLFQHKNDLKVDGIVGPNTYNKLLSYEVANLNKPKYVLTNIIDYMKSKKYKVREKPYEINILGVRRSKNVFTNQFSDRLVVFWRNKNLTWDSIETKWTTFPGTLAPGGVFQPITHGGIQGVAVLEENQYVETYTFVDTYNGWLQYPYFYQSKTVRVLRDGTKDVFVDFDSPKQEGLFGINIHRMSNNGIDTNTVNSQFIAWTIGCQGSPEPSFKQLVDSARYSHNIYKQMFDYTLASEKFII
jgi:hypothetical protein